MNGLKTTFEGQVDFFDLNIDDPSLDGLREEFDISGRSQYILVDANGNVVRRWFGPLNPTITQEVNALLEELNS